jgi:hypothetical protein
MDELKNEAIIFCSILPELFSSDLDRISMWERIGNGVSSAVKKCGGDIEQFVNIVLEFIKANSAMVASNDRLERFLLDMEQRSDDDKKSLLRIVDKKTNVILVYARNQWNALKDSKRQLKDGE